MPIDERTFLVIWAVGMLVTWPPWFSFAVRSRRKRSEPLRPRRPADALYFERGASGSARGWLGGASKALSVAVTPDELWIAPIFPLTLFFPYGAYGLDHREPKARIVRAEPTRSLRSWNVELELPGRDWRRNAELKLKLKDPEAFLAALRPVR
jgi:hypothetical protein